jgi:hypothetical protein
MYRMTCIVYVAICLTVLVYLQCDIRYTSPSSHACKAMQTVVIYFDFQKILSNCRAIAILRKMAPARFDESGKSNHWPHTLLFIQRLLTPHKVMTNGGAMLAHIFGELFRQPSPRFLCHSEGTRPRLQVRFKTPNVRYLMVPRR